MLFIILCHLLLFYFKLFGDSIIGFPKHRFVQLLWNQVNVFYYKISYVGRFSSFLHPGNEPWGVEHGDCIMYVLENRNVMPGITSNDAETITIERMTRMWVNFAYTGLVFLFLKNIILFLIIMVIP